MPAAVRNPKAAQAGHKLRQLREAKQWVLRDVENESRRRWGEEGTLLMAQVSRIEKGLFDRVAIDDAVRLGLLYGLTPNQTAELYGLWEEHEPARPAALVEADLLAKTLPEDLRNQFLEWVRFASMQIRYEAKQREATGEASTPPSGSTKQRLFSALSRDDN